MSNRSEYVKQWRRNTKNRIVQAFGGKCNICGYDKCQDALELHHFNPNEKEFSFGGIRSNPKNWASLVVELRKCILVCSNCHKEIHAGVTQLPEVIIRFNENFTTYKEDAAESFYDRCPVCDKRKKKSLITCSLQCGAKHRYKIDWDSIDLIDLFYNQKISKYKISQMLGCSDVSVSKRLKKLEKERQQ